MQPCTTCGSTTVNPIGYCTGCGAFRGTESAQGPAQPYAQPQSYEQYPQYQQPDAQFQQPAYGQYGPPAPQYPPQQFAPQAPQPFAPQPYAPQPFAPQPFAPQPPQRRSNTGLVVGIVMGVLVLLIGGGAALALVLDDDEPTRPPGPTPTAASSAASTAGDPCIVGVWVEKQSNYVYQVDGVSVDMTASGATQRFREDGTGELDMTANIVATGTAGGKKYERTTNGRVRFKYRPEGGKIYYSDVTGSGVSTLKVDGVATGTPIPVTGSLEPDTYTCSGSTFIQSGTGYRIELVKQ